MLFVRAAHLQRRMSILMSFAWLFPLSTNWLLQGDSAMRTERPGAADEMSAKVLHGLLNIQVDYVDRLACTNGRRLFDNQIGPCDERPVFFDMQIGNAADGDECQHAEAYLQHSGPKNVFHVVLSEAGALHQNAISPEFMQDKTPAKPKVRKSLLGHMRSKLHSTRTVKPVERQSYMTFMDIKSIEANGFTTFKGG